MRNRFTYIRTETMRNILPTGREFTLIEMVVDLEIDHSEGTTRTSQEYADRWQWPESKVVDIRNRLLSKDGYNGIHLSWFFDEQR